MTATYRKRRREGEREASERVVNTLGAYRTTSPIKTSQAKTTAARPRFEIRIGASRAVTSGSTFRGPARFDTARDADARVMLPCGGPSEPEGPSEMDVAKLSKDSHSCYEWCGPVWYRYHQ